MRRLTTRLARIAAEYEPRGMPLSVARTILAVADLTVLCLTPEDVLFAEDSALPAGGRCSGINSLSLWCTGLPHVQHTSIAGIIAACTLLVVASGYRPRWTCIPHWYITFSLAATIAAPNGGESVAAIATLLLIPTCLGDRRTWQWSTPAEQLDPTWRGAACAAALTIRLQTAVIYATAATSKLRFDGWLEGTALYNVAFDPNFGFPPVLRSALAPVLSRYPLVAAATWGVLVLELGVAVLVLGSRRMRGLALAGVIALHLAIIAAMGLPSFGVIMIALALLAYGGVSRSGVPATRPSPSTVSV